MCDDKVACTTRLPSLFFFVMVTSVNTQVAAALPLVVILSQLPSISRWLQGGSPVEGVRRERGGPMAPLYIFHII